MAAAKILAPAIREDNFSLDREKILGIASEPEWYLLRSLWKLQLKLGRAPEASDIDRAYEQDSCPSKEEFYACFKKIRFARTAAGLATDRGSGIEAQKANLLLDLIELSEREGGTLNASKLIEGSKNKICRTSGTYARAFGSIDKAFRLAHVVPNKKKTKLTKESVLDELIKYKSLHNKFPGARELTQQAGNGPLPSFTTIVRMFGSYDEAKRQVVELIRIINEQDVSDIGTFNVRSLRSPISDRGKELFSQIVYIAQNSCSTTLKNAAQLLLMRYFSEFSNTMSHASGRDLNVEHLLLMSLGEISDPMMLSRAFHINLLRECNLSFDEEYVV